jgi:hypothetical protein
MVGYAGRKVRYHSDLANVSLGVLNCAPVRFAASPQKCLEKGEHDGLNSNVNFDFVLVDTQMVDKATLTKMQALQPKAKVSAAWIKLILVCISRARCGSSRGNERLWHHCKLSKYEADLSAMPL